MNPPPNPLRPSKLAWAYASQLALVAVLYWIGVQYWGIAGLAEFIVKTGKDWAQLEGVILAASLVVWGMYVNFTTSGFGDYLRWSGRELSYRISFTTAIFAPLLAAILLIIAANTSPNIIHQFAILTLLYSMLEIYGTYRNIVSLSEKKRLYENLDSNQSNTGSDKIIQQNETKVPPH